jgi:Cd2+/Zn2+-exporting ATPase
MDLRVNAAPASRQLRERLEPTLTQAEQRAIRLRFGGALLAGGLLAVGWIHDWLFPGQKDVGALILAIGAVVAAVPVLVAGLRGFLAPTPHSLVEQLVSLAVLAAIAVGDYTTAILVPLLISIGHFLEERGILGARAAIEGLRQLQPQRAHRRRADSTESGWAGGRRIEAEEVPVSELAVGDVLIVRPGEVFPADGKVLRGSTAVDASTMTGESVPEEIDVGDEVFAGTINLTGLVALEVTGLGEKSAIGRILEVLREAEQSKPAIVRLLERYASYYLPLVLVATAAVLVVSQQLDRAIAMLVVSCPCALVLASPAAMTAVLAVASRLGILIKNTRFLEVLGQVDTVVLDKTGTATFGELTLVEILAADDVEEPGLVDAALSCARGSGHPVSRAVVSGLRDRSPNTNTSDEGAGDQEDGASEVTRSEELGGRGVEATLEDGRVRRLGRAGWLTEECGLELPASLAARAVAHRGPVVWIAEDERVLGTLLLADRPRPEVPRALAELRRLGVKRALLVTGDRREVAEAIAEELGIDQVEAECLPQRKLEVVSELQRAGHKVLVVGDGVNDALALSHGDVGVALGAMGSDVALSSADVALMGNDLTRLGTMIELGRRARTTIYQNVAVAIVASLVMLVLAGAGLISPVVGAVIHNAGAFLVVANSARVLREHAPAALAEPVSEKRTRAAIDADRQ